MNVQLFLLLLAKIAVLCFADPISTDCHLNFEYYCQNLKLAHKCDAVESCALIDWKYRSETRHFINDPDCTECLTSTGSPCEGSSLLSICDSNIPVLRNLSRRTQCIIVERCKYQEPICESIDEFTYCADRWSRLRLSPLEEQDPGCEQCQRVISLIHGNGDTALLNMINASCDGRRECTGPIFKHFTQIVGLRKRKSSSIRPSVICALVGKCNAKTMVLINTESRKRDSLLCLAMWKRVNNMLLNEEIPNADTIIDECLNIPGFTRAQCTEAVYHSVRPIEHSIQLGIATHYSTCDHLGMSLTSHPLVDELSTTNDLVCETCIVVVNTAKQMFNDEGPETIARIQTYISEHVCNRIPLITEKCRNFVFNETNLLLEYLENLEAVETCKALHACAVHPAGDETNNICTKCSDMVIQIRMSSICRVKKIFNFIIARICDFIPNSADKCAVAVSDMKERIVSVIQKVLSTFGSSLEGKHWILNFIGRGYIRVGSLLLGH
ncbi:hypothetical protein ACOME3_009123 [Neoechinorhynchus agilis]